MLQQCRLAARPLLLRVLGFHRGHARGQRAVLLGRQHARDEAEEVLVLDPDVLPQQRDEIVGARDECLLGVPLAAFHPPEGLPHLQLIGARRPVLGETGAHGGEVSRQPVLFDERKQELFFLRVVPGVGEASEEIEHFGKHPGRHLFALFEASRGSVEMREHALDRAMFVQENAY